MATSPRWLRARGWMRINPHRPVLRPHPFRNKRCLKFMLIEVTQIDVPINGIAQTSLHSTSTTPLPQALQLAVRQYRRLKPMCRASRTWGSKRMLRAGRIENTAGSCSLQLARRRTDVVAGVGEDRSIEFTSVPLEVHERAQPDSAT